MSSKNKKPILAVTMGDAAGIGPEVALKACSSPEINSLCLPLLVGVSAPFLSLKEQLKIGSPLRTVKDLSEVDGEGAAIPILEVEANAPDLPFFGQIDAAWADLAMRSVKTGAELVRTNRASALVTAPINKEGIHRAGYRCQGHTDFLARLTESPNHAMMLIGGPIRVVLVTVHVPLARVSGLLTTEEIRRKIDLAYRAMIRFGVSSPRIAVAGLNPHAGEGGAFGDEEEKIILPAVESCRREGMNVSGPLPPDTLFHQLYQGKFDVAVVMYHDQGLIPLKMIAFDKGVNLTLGLPIIRTSPDHGTAFEIAGKGIADPGSMIEAIKVACRLVGSA